MRIRVGRTRYMADEGPVSAWARLSSRWEWRVFKPTVQRWPFFGPFWGFLPSRRSGDLLVVAGSTPEAKPRSPVLQNPLRVYLYRELISNLAIQGDRSMATGHCVWRYPKMPTFVWSPCAMPSLCTIILLLSVLRRKNRKIPVAPLILLLRLEVDSLD